MQGQLTPCGMVPYCKRPQWNILACPETDYEYNHPDPRITMLETSHRVTTNS
jgi:hypothetical protein